MLKVKDVMTTDVVTVKSQTSVYEAIQELIDNNITGLPVVDDDMTVAGVVSEKDMLKLLYDLEKDGGTVADHMTETAASFDPEDNLLDICNCFMKNPFRTVPILSDGKLAGIISRADIIEYILKIKQDDEVQGPQ
jgi:CBS domain-containing protein